MPQPLFVILLTILSTFTCIYSKSCIELTCIEFFLRGILIVTTSISSLGHHLKRTINKPLTGSIGLRHVTTSRVHQNWVAKCYPLFPKSHFDLTKTFKWNTIYLTFTFQRLSNNNNNDSSLLLFDGPWKEKVRCRNRNNTICIFPCKKMFKHLEILWIMKLYARISTNTKIISI